MTIKITSVDAISFKIEAYVKTTIKPKSYSNTVFGNRLSLINVNEKADVLVKKINFA